MLRDEQSPDKSGSYGVMMGFAGLLGNLNLYNKPDYLCNKMDNCAGHCAIGSRAKPLLANSVQRPIT